MLGEQREMHQDQRLYYQRQESRHSEMLANLKALHDGQDRADRAHEEILRGLRVLRE